MKTAIILTLLAIGYSVYWNWRRAARAYEPIAKRSQDHRQIDQLMMRFGENREQLAEIKKAFASRFGCAAELEPSWSLVTRSVELSHENLNKFKFELALHFMQEAVSFAIDILNRKKQEQSVALSRGSTERDTASGAVGEAGLAETRRCVQIALERRG